MRYFILAALAAAVALCLFYPAAAAFAATAVLADGSTIVTIPWGDLVAGILPAAQILFMGGLLWVLSHFAPSLYAILRTAQVEQLMNRALDFAVNAVAGATKGKTLEIDTGNEVLKNALTYVLAHGGGWLQEFAGTPIELAEKLYARLDLPPEATKPDLTRIAAEAVEKAAA